MKIGYLSAAIGLSLFSHYSIAQPWIAPDDPFIRSSVELLVSEGVIERPVNTYPLMWQGIAQDLAQVSQDTLPQKAQFAYAHLKHALSFAKQKSLSGVRVLANSKPEAWQHFSARNQAKYALNSYSALTGKNVSAKFSVTYQHDALDGKKVNYDGSYLAMLLGNWSLSAEKIHHWWGPSNHNPLVLSNNAQAMLGARLTRHNSDYTGVDWLSFIGPWQFTLLGAQQKSQYKNAENGVFWGWRLSAMPVAGLEVALSQTDSEYPTLPSVKTGYAEFDSDIAKQLSSIDIKYSTTLLQQNIALYGEYTGHSRSVLIAKNGAFTLGAESFFGSPTQLIKAYFEYTNTHSACDSANPQYNCNYGVIGAATGYQHREQILAPSIGANAKAWTLGANYHTLGGYGGHVHFSRLTKPSSMNAEQEAQVSALELGYQQRLFNGRLNATVALWRETEQAQSDNHHSVQLSWEYRF